MRVITFIVALACATEVSPVQKVVQLLGELQTKVVADLKRESQLMDEYTAWCDEEANEKEDAITSSARTIADSTATIADAEATIMSLTSKIGASTTKISTAERELSDANSLRKKTHDDFIANEKELVETVDTLERAGSVLKRNLGLMQGGKVNAELKSMLGGLQNIVDASWVSSSQKDQVQALLQSSTDDEDLSFQPQATASSYESKSGGILDTVADMQAKAEASLSSVRKDEMESGHAFAMLKQGLEDKIAVMKDQLADASMTKSTTQEELHAASRTLSEEQKTTAADKQYLEELKASCMVKATEWTERQKSAAEEQEAINKAKEILENGVQAFLQTSSKVSVESNDRRSQLVTNLRNLGKKFHSVALLELSGKVATDPFGKIRGLIEGMIGKLVKEAAEEADQKAFCDEENSKSVSKKDTLSLKLDKNGVRIEKAEAGKAQLSQAIMALEAEIADMDAASAESTKIRQDEHAEFLSASEEYKQSTAAVQRAIQVLTEYYNSGAFVQVSASPDFGEAKSDVASTITSMLEVAESDFTRLLAEAESGEESAQTSYDKLVQDNKVAKVTKEGDIKGKTQEVAQLENGLLNYKEDQQTLGSELDAVLSYLDKLKPQCETKVMSYAEKKARREEEIAGLKEALTILAADSFLQVSSFLQRH